MVTSESIIAGNEHVANHSLVGIVILASVVAAMTTCLASSNDAAWESLSALVDCVSIIPARSP